MKIIYTSKKKAKSIMQKDLALLDSLEDEPILHFYDWKSKNTLTYGHFIDISKHIDLKAAFDNKLDYAKRPTGGGIVFHIWDLAFSFLMPSNHKNCYSNTLDNYKFINSIVLKSLSQFLKKSFLLDNKKLEGISNFCMAKPTKYDVVFEGKKIAGSAQRRKPQGYLHQASICLNIPDKNLLKKLLIDESALKSIFLNSHPVFLKKNIKVARDIVKKNLQKIFEEEIS